MDVGWVLPSQLMVLSCPLTPVALPPDSDLSIPGQALQSLEFDTWFETHTNTW